jgi:hypothetical protein
MKIAAVLENREIRRGLLRDTGNRFRDGRAEGRPEETSPRRNYIAARKFPIMRARDANFINDIFLSCRSKRAFKAGGRQLPLCTMKFSLAAPR